MQAFTKVQENLAAPPPPPPPPPPPGDRDGDGVPDAQDCGPADPAIKPGAADAPDLAFVDSNCDGIDGTETKAVFVSLQGKDTNAGTKAAPLRTLQAAIVQASQQNKDVYAAAGVFDRVELADAVGVYGGYRADTWARALTQVTGISGAPEGVLGVNATGVVLQHLTVVGTGGGRNGASAYGIRLVGGSKVTLQRVVVQGGGGTGGDPGQPGRTGADGGPGAAGTLGECDGKDPGRGGRGGASPAGRLGGRGGDGGTGDHFGATGAVGVVDTPGGTGGKGTSTPVSPGRRGNDGANGSHRRPGRARRGRHQPTAAAAATWQGQDGKPGTTGAPGDGGGGGGGGGGQGSAFVYDGTGNGGGGGGGGAAGGTGGGGGSAGGGSFGIYLSDSTVTVSQGSTVTSARGGAGGNGGLGGAGGTGGDPGLGAVHCIKEIGAGGNGGVGGKGGVGGGGGGGAGGPSIGIFKAGASTALVAGSTVTAGSPRRRRPERLRRRVRPGRARPRRRLGGDLPGVNRGAVWRGPARAASHLAARQEPELRRAPCGVASRRSAELRQHGGDVVLGRARRDHQLVGDLRVREPGREQREHLELPRRQAGRVRARRLARAVRHRQPELAHAPRDAARQRLRAEVARDLERLDERLLVVEHRQHQAAVVGPARRRRSRRPPPASSRASMSACGDGRPGGSISTSSPATFAQAPKRIASRVLRRPSSSARRIRSTGIGPPFVSAHSAASSSAGTTRCGSPVRSACAARSASRSARVVVAAADGEVGEHRAGEDLRHGRLARDLGEHDPLGLVPVAGAQLEPGDDGREVRR